MTEDLIGAIAGLVLLGLVFAPIFADIYGAMREQKEKKLRIKYSAYYDKIAEQNKISLNRSYKELKAIQYEINKLTEELRYVPDEEIPALKNMIKHWKQKYQKTKIICENKKAEIDKIQMEIMEIYHATPELMKFYKYSE